MKNMLDHASAQRPATKPLLEPSREDIDDDYVRERCSEIDELIERAKEIRSTLEESDFDRVHDVTRPSGAR